jgi:hypothetical protein
MQDKDPSAKKNSLPFFTRFLEGQNVSGPSSATYKYPSDWDEIVTMKYPSDDDEGGGEDR